MKKDAVPTLFFDYPSYLTAINYGTTRSCPEKKLMAAEEKNVQEAIKQSMVSKTSYDSQRTFCNIGELSDRVRKFKPSPFWSVVHHDSSIMFLNLEDTSGVTLNYAFTINDALQMKMSYRGEFINNFDEYHFPMNVSNINNIYIILEKIEKLENCERGIFQCLIEIIQHLLDEVTELLSDKKKY